MELWLVLFPLTVFSLGTPFFLKHGQGRAASAQPLWPPEGTYQLWPCLAVPVLTVALLEAMCEQSLSCSPLHPKCHVLTGLSCRLARHRKIVEPEVVGESDSEVEGGEAWRLEREDTSEEEEEEIDDEVCLQTQIMGPGKLEGHRLELPFA